MQRQKHCAGGRAENHCYYLVVHTELVFETLTGQISINNMMQKKAACIIAVKTTVDPDGEYTRGV